jgi:hypothetical protein
MGGFGSGRIAGLSCRPTCESWHSLDLAWLRREGLLNAGRWSTVRWSKHGQETGRFRRSTRARARGWGPGMKSAAGCLRVLAATLISLAREGDVEAFRAYVCSEEFLRAFNGLEPNRRQSAMRCHGKAEALCEAKARHPLVQPRRIDAKRAQKVEWNDPAMRAKLADAYAQAGSDGSRCGRSTPSSRMNGTSVRIAKRTGPTLTNGGVSALCPPAHPASRARADRVDIRST